MPGHEDRRLGRRPWGASDAEIARPIPQNYERVARARGDRHPQASCSGARRASDLDQLESVCDGGRARRKSAGSSLAMYAATELSARTRCHLGRCPVRKRRAGAANRSADQLAFDQQRPWTSKTIVEIQLGSGRQVDVGKKGQAGRPARRSGVTGAQVLPPDAGDNRKHGTAATAHSSCTSQDSGSACKPPPNMQLPMGEPA